MNLDAPAVTALKNAAAPARFLEWMARHLDWPIGLGDFETPDDILYDFTAADLNIKPGEFAKIRSLRQLPPLETNQPWGIFLVEFEARRFSITALRKILSRLVPSRRNSLFHPVWNAKDLLFLCFWGSGTDRTVCLARFAEEPGGISSVRTIHCAPAAEDATHLMRFANRLAPLRWPASGTSADAWHQAWNQAFGTRWRAVITSSEQLATEMADLAVEIHNRVLDALEVETDDGFAHRLFKKVKSTLLHDVDESQFADMYAQTIVYGLFSARCLDTTPDTFSVQEAISLIPNTNPFLKGLMKDCFADRQRGGLSFDELGIGDVVDLFANVDAARIAADFGRRTGQGREDPVIYFYEEFLKRYDSAQKIACGEFYTPQPVVAFMVRAVDSLLKTRFNLPDGLATATTRTIRRRIGASNKTRPVHVPSVQILDPATGTGTFLRQIILDIHAAFARNYRQGHPAATTRDLAKAWSDYVDDHLLPRLNGFELMMAPYAIAHMKLAMVLQDTGYDFQGNGRLRVFLTNSLEEPGNANSQLPFLDDPLAAESLAANAIKKNPAINVVIGNPPYAGESQNRGKWILKLMEDYKKEPGGQVRLDERNPKWINDDYVKFLRLAQFFIERNGTGIVSFICPHGIIDNPTFRGIRWKLLSVFDELYVLDLHGNAKKRGLEDDENVFDIQQGVCILILIKVGGASEDPATVYHADLYGPRAKKFADLERLELKALEWSQFIPKGKHLVFKKQLSEDASNGFDVSKMFQLSVMGFQSHRDDFAVAFAKSQIDFRMKSMLDRSITDRKIQETFEISDNRDWNVSSARGRLRHQDEDVRADKVTKCQYRPFDTRWCYLDEAFMDYPRANVFRHAANRENYVLGVGRQGLAVGDIEWCLATMSKYPMDANIFRRGGVQAAPVFLYEPLERCRKTNLTQATISEFENNLSMKFSDECTEEGYFSTLDVVDYVYAILYSHQFHLKYADQLKIDYPRIPYPTDKDAFQMIARKGTELRKIHCQEDFPEAGDVTFDGSGGREVTQAKWSDGAVWINRGSCFAGVDEATWLQWIGGYQPLQKWLKDRKTRTLTSADISHYKRMVQALRRTRELMAEIDRLPLPWATDGEEQSR